MKKIVLTLAFFGITLISFSQDVEVNKTTGLVKVNGIDSFYAIKKNKELFNFDISIQNKNKEELAYLKCYDANTLSWEERGNRQGTYHRLTFAKSSNTVNVFPGMSTLKYVAKMFVTNKLIVNEAIDPVAERVFVVSNKGNLYQDPSPAPINVVINNPAPATNAPAKAVVAADILVKGSNIYNAGELVGTFKRNISADSTLFINVYKKDDNKVCTATHPLKNDDADWEVRFTDDKTITLLYNPTSPIEKLFKFLVEKGYL